MSMMKMMLMSTFMTLFSFTPSSMILILIFMTINIALITPSLSHSAWISYIIMLMMVGGLLILFIYMSSVLPNYTNKSKALPHSTIIVFMLTLMILTPIKNMNQSPPQSTMYLSLTPSLMTFSIIYLLMFLFSLYPLIKMNSGPLRSS